MEEEIYQPELRDIRKEPLNLPEILIYFIMEIFRNVSKRITTGRLSIYDLIALKYEIRVIHAIVRIRSDYDYVVRFEKIIKKIEEKEKDKLFWQSATKDAYLAYLDELFNWLDLEVSMFDKFNLAPAEDTSLMWQELDLEELGVSLTEINRRGRKK